jgi:hypothetical protein
VRFFLRLISAALLGFGFLMAAFTRRRQALHDIAANCIITVRPRLAPPLAHSPYDPSMNGAVGAPAE